MSALIRFPWPCPASPRRLAEPRQRIARLLEIPLNLLALVEDGAVAGAAQHVLVQVALAALALGPQPRK